MLTKTHKRLIVIIVAFIISAIVWQINASWGNDIWTLIHASILTFITVWIPFEIYFTFRDIWFDRWDPLYLKELEITNVRINIENSVLVANLIKCRDNNITIKPKNTIIIVCHGFSDTKETMQYYSFPLAYQGYIILAYDARGIGESKMAGHRSDFSKRLDDFDKVLEWIQNHEDLNKLRIYALGISIGAIIVLCNGFPNKKVEKIVAISSVSHYKKSLSIVNPIVKFSYFIKGVDLNPNAAIDQKFSPYFIFEKIRKSLDSEEWKLFSKRVLLIHSKNDKIIPFKNFEEIVSLLELPSENLLILKKGGHMHKKNEVALVSATIRFFDLKDYTLA